MFSSASLVATAKVHAVDGDIGPVMDLLLDDRSWVARYLVGDAGSWLAGREVLSSPYSIKQPLRDGVLDVALTRRLVRISPAFDIDLPVSSVQDLVFDELSWQVRYLVVDTQAWWPGGRRALVGLAWVDRIDRARRQIHVALTRPQLKASPSYDEVASIRRDCEVLLHANCRRPGYWE